MTVVSVREIVDRINALAPELAPQLLPNGRLSDNKRRWMFSGIADKKGGESAYVELYGGKAGKWFDYGNAAYGEDKGDMLDLLRHIRKLRDNGAAIQAAKEILGIVDDWKPGKPAELSQEERAQRAEEARLRTEAMEREAEKERADKARRAKGVWLSGKPIAGRPAEAYLLGRLHMQPAGGWPGSLKYHPKVWCKALGREVPAMLASVVNADGEFVAVHRTFLQNCPRRGWTKLDIPRPKTVWGNMKGGFIPIAKGSSGKSMSVMPDGEWVYGTEGIEDALVVHMMKPEARVIAAYSVSNFGNLLLPSAARDLVIVADHDLNQQAESQLERSIQQQKERGVRVGVVMPPESYAGFPVKDMNDWLDAWLKSLELQRKGAA